MSDLDIDKIINEADLNKLEEICQAVINRKKELGIIRRCDNIGEYNKLLQTKIIDLKNDENYEGNWVALSYNNLEVISFGESMETVMEEAYKKCNSSNFELVYVNVPDNNLYIEGGSLTFGNENEIPNFDYSRSPFGDQDPSRSKF